MKILILSFYYAPDLCAGSFRTTALIEALTGMLAPDARVDVITTLPNRYRTFSQPAQPKETDGIVTITRLPLPAHDSGMLDQSKAFAVFANAAYRHAVSQDYDAVYATSSRLMTAVLGACVARRIKAPLYLDIRDLFVDTMRGLMPGTLARVVVPILSRLERYCIRSASVVNVVSPGFMPYFRAKYPTTRYSCHTNGIDELFLGAGLAASSRALPPVLNVTYAGNIGEGQGLHVIVPQLANILGGRVHFRIVGAGGRLGQLRQQILRAGCTNVEIIAPMGRPQLLALYDQADVLFLHLNDYAAFEKVLPSKIFEYAASGKPVWAGVAGYAARFIEEHVPNAAVFAPCDVLAAVKAFDALDLNVTPREAFVSRYRRGKIMSLLASELVSMAGAHRAHH